MFPMSEGTMIILSSPSGAGKTTLVKLLSERKDFITSISHTTRTPRSNEVDGKDYYLLLHSRNLSSVKHLYQTASFSLQLSACLSYLYLKVF